MATIKEIAQRAGVSTTTVSNVIHGKTKKVSPANIQKIENLIREMGYVQKMGLRVLNKEKSQLIAVVINHHKDFKDSVIGDPFYGKIIGFIEKYVQELGTSSAATRTCRKSCGRWAPKSSRSRIMPGPDPPPALSGAGGYVSPRSSGMQRSCAPLAS